MILHGLHLSQQAFWATQCYRRVLRIAHLHAGKREPSAMLCADLDHGVVAVPAGCVVIAGRKLCCMAACPVPPVDARYLQRHLNWRTRGEVWCRGGLKLKCTKSSTDTAHDDELTVRGCMAALSVPQVKARHLQGHLSEAQRGSLVSIDSLQVYFAG